MQGNPRDSDADRLLKAGIHGALAILDAAEASGALTLDRFEYAAIRCAQHGIPIETVHATVTASVLSAWGDLASDAELIEAGPDAVLGELIAMVSRAYS
ncbi:hypothetical protein ACFVMC_26405 [Nocardia sp. NPDC127579]|uniref:hypothetical protein n=1 Tax=Nocardia sp. NPDC127579 TaxID=3345402 RepID=UPI0036294061